MLEGRLRDRDGPAAVEQVTAVADAFDLEWIVRSTGRGERRQMVVLAIAFAPDTAGDPEALADSLTRRRNLVSSVVARFAGRVGRVDPELQLAWWGWPTASETDMRLAIAAALQLVAVPGETIRCSLDVGIAITPESAEAALGVGFVGEMIGNAVLQVVAAGPCQVLVSDTLRGLIGEHFELAPIGAQLRQARHWQVLGAKASPAEPAAPVLIGRDWHVGAVRTAWRAVANGGVRLMRIEGEAGVGRSAVVAALRRIVLDEAGLFHCVACRPELQAVAMAPIEALIERVRDGITLEAGSVAGGRSAPAKRLDATARADELGALLAAQARLQPLVVVLEDVHWADEATLAVVKELEARSDALGGVMLVRTERREGPEADGHGRWLTVDVSRLHASQIEELLCADTHGARLDREARLRITDHAEGNPFVAAELARIYAQNCDSEAHHRLLARPNRLNMASARSLDALGPLKPLVQAAAVLGRTFDARVLSVALDADLRNIEQRLGQLVGLEIFVRVGEHEAERYRFTRALIWSHAYGSVLKARRRKLHLRIAGFLEGQSEQLGIAAEVVAHHWRKAGDQGRAFPWLCRAARSAAERGAVASAVSFIHEALAVQGEKTGMAHAQEEAELMSLLGAQMRALRGSASRDTVAAYERAYALISELPDKPADLDLDIAWGMTTIHLVRGDVADATVAGERLVAVARDRGRDDMVLMALRLCGTARLLSGRVADAVASFAAAVAMYDQGQHGQLHRRYVSEPGVVAFAHLASAKALAGDVDGSRRAMREALARASLLGHAYTTANVLGVLTLAAAHLGETGLCVALSRAGLEIAEGNGYKYWAARARLILAWRLGYREPDKGLEAILHELENYRGTGAGRAVVFANCLAADVAIRAGQPQTALDLLGPARAKGEQQGELIYLPEVMRLEAAARAHLDPQATDAADTLLQQAEALALAHGCMAYAARAVKTREELASLRTRRAAGGRKAGVRRRGVVTPGP